MVESGSNTFTKLCAADLLDITPDDLDISGAILMCDSSEAFKKIFLHIDGIDTSRTASFLAGLNTVETRTSAEVDDLHAFIYAKFGEI